MRTIVTTGRRSAQLLDVKDLARMFRTSVWTIYRMAAEDILPASSVPFSRTGKRRRIWTVAQMDTWAR